ncbi:MAG: thioredoxin domain-containing protein [Ferruginibacter sp.]
MGIENGAFAISEKQLSELTAPYLVHLYSNGGQFQIVNSNPYKEIKDFDKNWSKIVVVAEKAPAEKKITVQTPEKVKKINSASIFLISILVLFNLASIFINKNFENIILNVVSLAGIIISVFILLTELGIAAPAVEKFCSEDTCNKLISDSKIKMPFGLSLGDLSLAWFITVNIINSFHFLLFQQLYFTLSYVSLTGVVVAALSLFYQAFVAKAWCRLCLLIVVLLVSTSCVLVPFMQQLEKIKFPVILGFVAIFLFTITGWSLIKQVIKQKIKAEDKMMALLRYKYNWRVFKSLLKDEEELDILPIANEIQLGNPNASCVITVTSSLTCMPCAVAHEQLELLVNEIGDKIALNIRFLVRDLERDPNKIQMISYVLSVLHTTPQSQKGKVLHDWYQYMDLEKFKKHYPLSGSPVKIVQDHVVALHEWAMLSGITETPSFFINERKLPNEVFVDDLLKIFRFAVLDDLRTETVADLSY